MPESRLQTKLAAQPGPQNQQRRRLQPSAPSGWSREIKVEASGFKVWVHKVSAGAQSDGEGRCQDGGRRDHSTTEITAAAPVLQTDTAALGTVIDSRTNVTPARDPKLHSIDTSGSGSLNQSIDINRWIRIYGGRPYINGNREQANNFLLDGSITTRFQTTLSVSRRALTLFRIHHDHQQRLGRVWRFSGRVISVLSSREPNCSTERVSNFP
jgi:hypothetical protein